MPEFTTIEAAIRRMLARAAMTEAKRRHLERILEEIEQVRAEERPQNLGAWFGFSSSGPRS